MRLFALDDRGDGAMQVSPQWLAAHQQHMCWRCGMLDRRFGLPDVQVTSPFKLHAHIWGLYKFQILVMSKQLAEFIGWDLIHRDLITSRLLHADGSVQDNGIACWAKEIRVRRAYTKADWQPCEGCARPFYSGGSKKYCCLRTPFSREIHMCHAGGLLVTEPIAERLQSPAAKAHFRPKLNLRYTPVDVLPEPIDGYPELPDAWLTPTSPDDPPMWQNAIPFAAKVA